MKYSLKKLGKIGKIGKMLNYQKLLTNKYILYLVLFLSCLFLFSLLLAKKICLIIIFALIGYIIWFYNKNMTIVLGLSLIITFIANLGVKVKEGLENMSTDDTTSSVTGTKPKPATTTPATTTPATTTPATTTPATTTPATTTPATATPSTETMNNISGKRNRLDYASTVEDAYDDLSKILGGDGIKRLTGDTQQLLEQQVQLVDAMKTMTPLIETAKGLLNGLNMDGLNGLTDIAQKLMPTNR
jgi:hypothetical protein